MSDKPETCERCDKDWTVHKNDEYLCFGCFVDSIVERTSSPSERRT